jgi:hypothetical protein
MRVLIMVIAVRTSHIPAASFVCAYVFTENNSDLLHLPVDATAHVTVCFDTRSFH